MRLWSLHPKYLDSKGLVALWRETLLARNVLEGKTIGYRHHPQLERFKKSKNPLNAINQYLSFVYSEALDRSYKFSEDKIDWNFIETRLSVTEGQVNFEAEHLLKKLEIRDIQRYKELKNQKAFAVNPIFELIPGDVESWEIG
ncbi:MAG: pyrimidine dimer DNA glycosylase/endonuclease V [Lentisphaerota bacterium]